MAKKLNISESVSPTTEVLHISKSAKDAANDTLMKLMEEESKMVRGIFQFFENPGASQKITYKKYPTPAEMRARGKSGGVAPFSQTMTDGQEYEIPLYVARFLNGTDVSAGILGDPNKRNKNIGSCSFSVHGFKHSAGSNLPSSQDGFGPAGEGGIPVPIVGITKRVKRYGFQSLEFAGAES